MRSSVITKCACKFVWVRVHGKALFMIEMMRWGRVNGSIWWFWNRFMWESFWFSLYTHINNNKKNQKLNILVVSSFLTDLLPWEPHTTRKRMKKWRVNARNECIFFLSYWAKMLSLALFHIKAKWIRSKSILFVHSFTQIKHIWNWNARNFFISNSNFLFVLFQLQQRDSPSKPHLSLNKHSNKFHNFIGKSYQHNSIDWQRVKHYRKPPTINFKQLIYSNCRANIWVWTVETFTNVRVSTTHKRFSFVLFGRKFLACVFSFLSFVFCLKWISKRNEKEIEKNVTLSQDDELKW